MSIEVDHCPPPHELIPTRLPDRASDGQDRFGEGKHSSPHGWGGGTSLPPCPLSEPWFPHLENGHMVLSSSAAATFAHVTFVMPNAANQTAA